jgi:hypothetical protein
VHGFMIIETIDSPLNTRYSLLLRQTQNRFDVTFLLQIRQLSPAAPSIVSNFPCIKSVQYIKTMSVSGLSHHSTRLGGFLHSQSLVTEFSVSDSGRAAAAESNAM